MSIHTLEEAMTRFVLIKDTPGDGETTACAMSMLAWIDGGSEEWTDRPECVHRFVAQRVIGANDGDETTDLDRVSLVEAGMTGALDTAHVPDVVVVAAIAAGNKAVGRLVDRTLESLRWLATRKTDMGADLKGADIAGANLKGANLTEANLAGANLAGANLAGANLYRAYLAGADLYRADLKGANLMGTDLYSADLYSADLAGAYRSPFDPPIPGWKTASGRLVRQGDEA